MKHDNDHLPMTPEKAIKLKGHEYIMAMQSVGVPVAKSNLAALVMALELRNQFNKIFQGTEAERQKKLRQFDLLETGIKGYLPMPSELFHSKLIAAIEAAFEESETISDFKARVLDIITNPKTKTKLFA